MNFFGHAAVASWSGGAAGIALGAMLPDFASMSGGRLAATQADATVATGIDLHHRTDGVFHQLAPVTALMRELGEKLDRGGCARGPRRAVAHIGVELLLDGVLVDDPAYRDAYLEGLACEANVVWREPPDRERFAMLLARLRTHGVPDDLRKPEAIAIRLSRMLSHRPLLAPNADDMTAIRAALIEYKPRIDVAAHTVMRAVRAAM